MRATHFKDYLTHEGVYTHDFSTSIPLNILIIYGKEPNFNFAFNIRGYIATVSCDDLSRPTANDLKLCCPTVISCHRYTTALTTVTDLRHKALCPAHVECHTESHTYPFKCLESDL